MKYYFIHTIDEETTIGLAVDNKLRLLERHKTSSLRDDIFIAKIVKEIPSISGYIIEIEKDVKGCIDKRFLPQDIKMGEEILVQLYKKTSLSKLNKFTMDYSISGKNLIYYPLREKNVFSRKIKKEMIEEFLLKNDLSTFKGITFRTKSLENSIEILERENSSLKELNDYIVQQSKFLPIPRKVYSNIKFIYEVLDEDFDYIITNDKESYNGLRKYFKNKKIIYDENYNYEYDENISNDLVSLNNSKVDISKNINIIVEKTEALTVIDVNSSSEKSFLDVNKEAVLESLRQIELRDIKGIILVDAITMNKKQRKELINFIKDIIGNYSKINFEGISNTGLLEFVRMGINIDN
ncbi:ribonuclease E/G [Peptostreptococcaceae bacterium OttesenSCG-928-C18]|nr:ribonuclease E/G [Peptostreptococcaceae bacterium OttesenSCG-928-C18]